MKGNPTYTKLGTQVFLKLATGRSPSACSSDAVCVILELASAIVEKLEEHGGHVMNVIVWMFNGELPTPDLPHSDDFEWWAAALIKLEPLAGFVSGLAKMN